MNCKSFSVITEPISFLLQPELMWPAVLFSSYWSFDFNAARFQNFFLNFWIFSYYWLPLKSYPIILTERNLIGLEKTFNGSLIKFSEKNYCLNGFDIFFTLFSTEFLLLPIFIVVFIDIKLIVISDWILWLKNILVLSLRNNWSFLLTSVESYWTYCLSVLN